MSEENIIEEQIIWNLHDILLIYVDEGEYGITLERKAQAGFLPKIGKIEVYADHDPKHFHIKTDRLNMKFKIENLEQIYGEPLNSKQKKNLNHWYFENRGQKKVINLWNERNPNNPWESSL